MSSTFRLKDSVKMRDDRVETNGLILKQLLLMLIAAVASLSMGLLPVLVGALADHRGLSLDVAGYIVSANIFGIAIGAGISAGLLKRLYIARVLVFSLLLLSLSDLLSIWAVDVLALMSTRIFSGIGAGLTAGCVAALIAGMPRAERGFGFCMVGAFMASVLGLYFLPGYIVVAGASGLFMLMGGAAVTAMVLIPLIKDSASVSSHSHSHRGKGMCWDKPSLLLYGYILFQMIACGGIWAFIERAGYIQGWESDDIGLVLAFSSLLGVASALAVGPLVKRFSSHVMLSAAAGIAVFAVMLLALFHETFFVYCIGIFIASLLWAFVIPVAQYLLAQYSDGSEQVAAFAVLMYWIGLALGPFVVGGVLSERNNFAVGFWVCTILYAVSLVCSKLLKHNAVSMSDVEVNSIVSEAN